MRRVYFRAREKTSFAYRGLARSASSGRALFIKQVKVAIAEVEIHEHVVAAVGFLTFFFGFGAGAVLNLYLLTIGHPLVTHLRSTLSYKSAIIGDGIVLPIVNMIAVSYLLKNSEYVSKRMVQLAMLIGGFVTIWFHMNQAVQGLVNWAMPTPWHWNLLGIWHALYMLAVASLLSLFYLVTIKVTREEKDVPLQPILVTAGIIVFFILLRLDYIAIDFFSFLPSL